MIQSHFAEYGIHPIFYKKDVLLKLYDGDNADWHSYCRGILLENLLRRKMHYHQPLALLWNKCQFVPLEMSGIIKNAVRLQSINESFQYLNKYHRFLHDKIKKFEGKTEKPAA